MKRITLLLLHFFFYFPLYVIYIEDKEQNSEAMDMFSSSKFYYNSVFSNTSDVDLFCVFVFFFFKNFCFSF